MHLEISISTSIDWGYAAEFASKHKEYTISIDNAVFRAVGGDTDIITFDNTNKTFTTHGTGTVRIRFTCGNWADEFNLKING